MEAWIARERCFSLKRVLHLYRLFNCIIILIQWRFYCCFYVRKEKLCFFASRVWAGAHGMCKISHQLSACHQLRCAYGISAQFRHGYTTETPLPPPGPLIQASLKKHRAITVKSRQIQCKLHVSRSITCKPCVSLKTLPSRDSEAIAK